MIIKASICVLGCVEGTVQLCEQRCREGELKIEISEQKRVWCRPCNTIGTSRWGVCFRLALAVGRAGSFCHPSTSSRLARLIVLSTTTLHTNKSQVDGLGMSWHHLIFDLRGGSGSIAQLRTRLFE